MSHCEGLYSVKQKSKHIRTLIAGVKFCNTSGKTKNAQTSFFVCSGSLKHLLCSLGHKMFLST